MGDLVRATMLVNETWLISFASCSRVSPILSAISASVGARLSSASSSAWARSNTLALDRTDRGTPVQRPQLVDDGTPDAVDRIGLELDLTADVELVDRVDQAEMPYETRSAASTLLGSPERTRPATYFDQRGVMDDQSIPFRPVTGVFVGLPQSTEGRRSGPPPSPRGLASSSRSGSSTGMRILVGRAQPPAETWV